MWLRRPPRAELVQGGFQFLEGPVWLPASGELRFSDIPASRIYRMRAGAIEVFRAPSGQANGNTLDTAGRLLTCEHETRRVSRTETDGAVTSLATHYEGKRLNSPNDVVVRKDGGVYFTDPPYGVKPEARELSFQGVYRLDAGAAGEPRLLLDDFDKPNGLAFSPDEAVLYVADTEHDHLRAFPMTERGELSGGRVFCRVPRPDGLRVDSEGTLWVAARDGVRGFDRNGKSIRRIAVPEQPANLAFGDGDRQTLYITARKGLYRIRMAAPGVA